ncbi:MAG: Uma2 family endonuclease [Oscillochloridaceae bacterium umkhey_bin13]
MTTEARWTSADLEGFPNGDGRRYEIIDGDLHVSKQPHWHHQFASGQITRFLQDWSESTGEGIAIPAPGLLFADDDDVVSDVVWYSATRLVQADRGDGKFGLAPELAIEILSPGRTNENRDREEKRQLYARRGVIEYWIIDWRSRQAEIYRREAATLRLVATLYANDELTSPLLPGFACKLGRLFVRA